MTEAELEQHLRDLYRGEDPPAALTERIFAHAGHARRRAHWLRRHAALLSVCTALTALCLVVALGVVHRRQAEARRAQQAQARLEYALQITTSELHWAENTITRDMSTGQEGVRK